MSDSTKQAHNIPYPSASASQRIAFASLVGGLSGFIHSLYARGLRRTLLFVALGTGLPIIGEFVLVNGLRILRHHTQPQVKGVPLSAVLGWYNIGYASFATVEQLLAAQGAKNSNLKIVVGTALTATSVDLLLDVAALDRGLWEWNGKGLYASDINGPNGQPGIPAINFLGWLALTGVIVYLYYRLSIALFDEPHADVRRASFLRRWAALLLAPYYLDSLSWAVGHRKFRFVLYSALVPLVVLRALRRS